MARQATNEEREEAARLEAALEQEEQAGNFEDDNAAGNKPDEKPDGQVTPTPSDPPKRKRGRPTDAERALRESLGEVKDAPAGAKRGPKPKGKRSDPASLAKSLVGIHQLAAMVTSIPECQLSEQEGAALAEAVTAVCDEYGLSIDGKTGAAMQLFGACAMIYGPRLFSFRMRMAQQRVQAEQQREGLNNVQAQAPGH
jgi:hypothetical protein